MADTYTIDNDEPIVFPGGSHDRLLERLQGNILKGHGRKFSVNIFLRFTETATPEGIRGELKHLASEYVTSASRQLVEADQYHKFGLPGRLFGNLFLSRLAYERLGFLPSELATLFADPNEPGHEATKANFLTGMKDAASDLRDALDDPAEPLETAYVKGHLDVLLLLADNSRDYLLRTARHEVDRILERGHATIVAVEHGAALRNEHGDGIEHFGYVDGRSQPLFLASDFSGLVNGKVVPGDTLEQLPDGQMGDLRYWNPFAKLSLALLKDPAVKDPDAYGSYYVFRKLEQNVQGFVDAERDLACKLGLEEGDPRAGAMAVGRFRDGTPLVLSETAGLRRSQANDFRYDGLDAHGKQPYGAPIDRFGLKCPFQAHIRKISPRQAEVFAGDFSARRIVRRGITYGTRPSLDRSNIHDLPTQGVGLLFSCFQRSIMRQFAFLQAQWSNNALFPIPGVDFTGADAVIGQTDGDPNAQHWRPEYGGIIEEPENLANLHVPDTHPKSFTFNGFVKFRGGEFFFAPSLPFLLGKY